MTERYEHVRQVHRFYAFEYWRPRLTSKAKVRWRLKHKARMAILGHAYRYGLPPYKIVGEVRIILR